MQEVPLEMVRNRSRSRSSQRSRRGRRQKQKEAAARQAAASIMGGGIEQGKAAAEMWSNTHRRLFQWHYMQVQRLCQGQYSQQEEREQCLEESSTSEAEEEPAAAAATPIDEEYLQFLAVTVRHQQELKQRRAAASISTPDSTLD